MLPAVPVLARAPHGVGLVVSPPQWVPAEATGVTLTLDNRADWQPLPPGEAVLHAQLELNITGTWVLLAGCSADATPTRTSRGDLLDATMLAAVLPRQRIPQPQLRAVVQTRSPWTGTATLAWETLPYPPLPPDGHHSVTFDAVATTKTSAATSLSWSHTCAGTNRLLVVGATTDAAVDTTGVTCGGTAMTLIRQQATGQAHNKSELYGRIAPVVGSNALVISTATSTGILGGSVSVTDADQTTGWRNATSATATSTGTTVTVTSAVDNLVVDVAAIGVNASGVPTMAVGGGQTARVNDFLANMIRGCMSTEPGAASVTMSWTASVSDDWTIVACDLMAVPAATKAPPPFHRSWRYRKRMQFV